ncbi:MAG: hypothetical protein WA160_02335 [Pseudobdellovibrio sp.]
MGKIKETLTYYSQSTSLVEENPVLAKPPFAGLLEIIQYFKRYGEVSAQLTLQPVNFSDYTDTKEFISDYKSTEKFKVIDDVI